MRNFRLLISACILCGATYGCATPEGQQQAAADDDNTTNTYRTGSRLPTYDRAGESGVRGVTRDDWIDERRKGGNQGFSR